MTLMARVVAVAVAVYILGERCKAQAGRLEHGANSVKVAQHCDVGAVGVAMYVPAALELSDEVNPKLATQSQGVWVDISAEDNIVQPDF